MSSSPDSTTNSESEKTRLSRFFLLINLFEKKDNNIQTNKICSNWSKKLWHFRIWSLLVESSKQDDIFPKLHQPVCSLKTKKQISFLNILLLSHQKKNQWWSLLPMQENLDILNYSSPAQSEDGVTLWFDENFETCQNSYVRHPLSYAVPQTRNNSVQWKKKMRRNIKVILLMAVFWAGGLLYLVKNGDKPKQVGTNHLFLH